MVGAPQATRPATRLLTAVIVPCLLAIIWLALRAGTFGSATSLLAIGHDSSAFPSVHRQLPNAYVFEGNGYDGMDYFVIANDPFDFAATSPYLDGPLYRLRRIVYPLAARAIDPAGGAGLVYAFAAVSLIGVGLGGWWLARMPGARPWLPLMMVLNPGMVVALWTSTADGLAAALTIACFGAAFRRKFALAMIFLAVAGLTKESSLIAVIPLAIWPGLTLSRRIAHLVAPTIPVVAWSLYLSTQLHSSIFVQSSTGNFGAPFLGWVEAGTPPGERLLALLLAGVCTAAIVRIRRMCTPVAVFLAMTLAMFVCFLPVNAVSWWGFARAMTAAFPLSIWALTAPPGAICRSLGTWNPRSGPSEGPTTPPIIETAQT